MGSTAGSSVVVIVLSLGLEAVRDELRVRRVLIPKFDPRTQNFTPKHVRTGEYAGEVGLYEGDVGLYALFDQRCDRIRR